MEYLMRSRTCFMKVNSPRQTHIVRKDRKHSLYPNIYSDSFSKKHSLDNRPIQNILCVYMTQHHYPNYRKLSNYTYSPCDWRKKIWIFRKRLERREFVTRWRRQCSRASAVVRTRRNSRGRCSHETRNARAGRGILCFFTSILRRYIITSSGKMWVFFSSSPFLLHWLLLFSQRKREERVIRVRADCAIRDISSGEFSNF